MPEKLLTMEEASFVLGLTESEIVGLVEKGELPAYRIGGEFLRFRREQIDAIKDEIVRKRDAKEARAPVASSGRSPAEEDRTGKELREMSGHKNSYAISAGDSIRDFFYFNDFYIISALTAALLLFFILKT